MATVRERGGGGGAPSLPDGEADVEVCPTSCDTTPGALPPPTGRLCSCVGLRRHLGAVAATLVMLLTVILLFGGGGSTSATLPGFTTRVSSTGTNSSTGSGGAPITDASSTSPQHPNAEAVAQPSRCAAAPGVAVAQAAVAAAIHAAMTVPAVAAGRLMPLIVSPVLFGLYNGTAYCDGGRATVVTHNGSIPVPATPLASCFPHVTTATLDSAFTSTAEALHNGLLVLRATNPDTPIFLVSDACHTRQLQGVSLLYDVACLPAEALADSRHAAFYGRCHIPNAPQASLHHLVSRFLYAAVLARHLAAYSPRLVFWEPDVVVMEANEVIAAAYGAGEYDALLPHLLNPGYAIFNLRLLDALVERIVTKAQYAASACPAAWGEDMGYFYQVGRAYPELRIMNPTGQHYSTRDASGELGNVVDGVEGTPAIIPCVPIRSLWCYARQCAKQKPGGPCTIGLTRWERHVPATADKYNVPFNASILVPPPGMSEAEQDAVWPPLEVCAQVLTCTPVAAQHPAQRKPAGELAALDSVPNYAYQGMTMRDSCNVRGFAQKVAVYHNGTLYWHETATNQLVRAYTIHMAGDLKKWWLAGAQQAFLARTSVACPCMCTRPATAGTGECGAEATALATAMLASGQPSPCTADTQPLPLPAAALEPGPYALPAPPGVYSGGGINDATACAP